MELSLLWELTTKAMFILHWIIRYIFCIVWTPIQYVTLCFWDRRGEPSLRYKNRAEITVPMCVWTAALSGMFFASAQKLFGIMWLKTSSLNIQEFSKKKKKFPTNSIFVDFVIFCFFLILRKCLLDFFSIRNLTNLWKVLSMVCFSLFSPW